MVDAYAIAIDSTHAETHVNRVKSVRNMSLSADKINVRSFDGISINTLLADTTANYAILQQEVDTLELNTDESLNSLNDRIGTLEFEYSSLLDTTGTLTSDITAIQAVDATASFP
jgi:hypothetical protein